MTTSTKTTTATTEKGTVLNMTVTAIRGFENVKETSFCDGDNIEIERGRETNKTISIIEINGKKYEGYFTTNMPQTVLKGCYGVFLAGTQPIGLSEKIYNKLTSFVNETKKEAEADESWSAYQAKKNQNEKEAAEYYKHKAAVENMMTLNNKTY